MRPLRYAINLTLDGCVDHTAGIPDEELHNHAAATLLRSDALLLGRVTYEMMESAWRSQPAADRKPTVPPDWREPWMEPFARTIDAMKKYVVSGTLPSVDWNAELVRGDLRRAIERLKAEPGDGIALGGVALPFTLAEMGLIDEYQFTIHPRIVGRGPTIFAGLSRPLDLRLIRRHEFASGTVVLTYEPRR